MYINRVSFDCHGSTTRNDETIEDAISSLLGTWRMSGQICGREWSIVRANGSWWCTVLSPESESLDRRFDGRYVSKALERTGMAGVTVTWQSLGEDPTSANPCACASPTAFALFTTYVSLESPVRCLDCFRPVALHRFKPQDDGEHFGVIGWQSNYQSCDSLQMNCTVLEQAATRELSEVDSDLGKEGRGLCDELSVTSGRPFYYYLYRNSGESRHTELERRCPGCGGAWALPARLHMFDFKCDRCRLLSNIAFSLES